MKGASEAGTGEDTSPREFVSPLEQMLDAAVESERRLPAIARRARERADELALAMSRPTPAALAARGSSDAASLRRARPTGQLPATPPAPSGAWAAAKPLGQRPAPEVRGWLQVSAVSLGVFALLTAFLGPVSPTSPAGAPIGELVAPTMRTPAAPAEPARYRGVEVANDESQQVDAERISRSSMPRALDPGDGAAARATLDSEARHPTAEAETRSHLDSEARRPGGVSASAGQPDPSRSSPAPAAQRAQTGARQVIAEKRANIVTVDDLFGIGGNEPLPPEALDAPPPASPLPARTGKRAHGAPTPSVLFYKKLPF